jgi:hypothetical protein
VKRAPALLLLGGCGGGAADSGPVWGADYCAWTLEDHAPAADEAGIEAALALTRAALYPDLAGVEIALDATDSDEDYFVTSVDLSEPSSGGADRRYLLRYSRLQFLDPIPYAGLAAVLAHELQHARDFVAMDDAALVAWALWYAEGDYAAYERATDEAVLEAGCGRGLIAFREWLYAHVDAETLAEKQRDYYTPEEIEAWMAAH